MSMLPTNILEVQAINPSPKEPPVKLRQLLELLQGFSSHDLIFRSDEGDIGGGYHVTELKQASINSIDCGGRTDEWTETVLQLLDGSGDTPMSIEKFVAIVRRSEVALPGLSDAPLYFEFGHVNL